MSLTSDPAASVGVGWCRTSTAGSRHRPAQREDQGLVLTLKFFDKEVVMSDFAGVWPAHKAADRLSSSLAFIYEEGQPAGQLELTAAQRQLLASEFAALVGAMAELGVIGAG